MTSTKKTAPQKPHGRKNARPMISKYVAPGIRALLATVDIANFADDYAAQRAHDYLLDLARYLEGPEYEAKSKRQSEVTKEWRRKAAKAAPPASGA